MQRRTSLAATVVAASLLLSAVPHAVASGPLEDPHVAHDHAGAVEGWTRTWTEPDGVRVWVLAVAWGAAGERPADHESAPIPPVAVPPPPVPDQLQSDPASARARGECSDRAHSATGGTWRGTYRWLYRRVSTPKGLGKKAATRALKRAMTNVTASRNMCGRADRVSATASFLGPTRRKTALTARGGCASRDGYNVVGFGKLPDGIAGLTCVWVAGGQILEADVRLDKGGRWATKLARCSAASMLEAVATHEFGHVFGLGHVSEARHGRLTMSTRLDGWCQNQESRLGLGDMLGLEKLY